jgi:hypothetical protein
MKPEYQRSFAGEFFNLEQQIINRIAQNVEILRLSQFDQIILLSFLLS